MLRDAQDAIEEFMAAAGQDVPLAPTIPSMDVMRLRHRLISEELHEFWLAVDSVYAMTREGHLEQVADALADLLYVVIGTGVAYGIDLSPVFEEVHRSNMTKFIDGYKREDGKWIKGPSYSPADLQAVLARQMD